MHPCQDDTTNTKPSCTAQLCCSSAHEALAIHFPGIAALHPGASRSTVRRGRSSGKHHTSPGCAQLPTSTEMHACPDFPLTHYKKKSPLLFFLITLLTQHWFCFVPRQASRNEHHLTGVPVKNVSPHALNGLFGSFYTFQGELCLHLVFLSLPLLVSVSGR